MAAETATPTVSNNASAANKGRFASYVEKTVAVSEHIRKSYALFLNDRPITVYFVTAFLLGSLTALGIHLNPLPDFSMPTLGFDTRGTVLSGRVQAWNALEEKTAYYPESSKEFFRQLPPTDILPRVTRSVDNMTNVNADIKPGGFLEDFFFRALTVSPCLQLNAPLNILESYSQVVVESPSTSALFSLKTIQELCYLQKQMNRTLHTLKIRPERDHFWSLPNYITCFSGEFTCSTLKENDVNTVMEGIRRCAPYQEQIIKCHEKSANKDCKAIPANCDSKYYYDLFYFVLSNNIFTNSSEPVYTSVILPMFQYSTSQHFQRTDLTLEKYMKIFKEVNVLKSSLQTVKMVGFNFGIKRELYEEVLPRDSICPLTGLVFVCLIICLYSHSLFYTLTVVISMVFSVGVAYFVYTLVFRIAFFPLMNLLAVVLLVIVGVVDTYVLKYVFDSSKKDKTKPISPEDTIDALSYCTASMLVTSTTMSSAYFTSLTSSIFVIKCFGIFAGTTMLMNYLVVVSFMPASLIILDRHINPYILRYRPRFLDTLSSRLRVATRFFSILIMQICLPFLVRKMKVLWICLFGMSFTAAFFIVFYKPAIALPERNALSLFRWNHPLEWYDDQVERHFRFALTKYQNPVNVNLFWGFLPYDGREAFEPQDLGGLVPDPTFKINLEVLRDVQAVCDRLAKSDKFTYDGRCFAKSYFDWSKQQLCLGKDDTCCNYFSKYYQDKDIDWCLAHFTITESVHDGGPIITYANYSIAGLQIGLSSNLHFSSRHADLKTTFDEVEASVSEILQQAKTRTVQNGWSITGDRQDAKWYDLQKEILLGTPTSIILSIFIAFLVSVFVTRTFLLSFLSILTVTAVILDTVAVLVLLGWRLYIVESTIIILTIGLSFDFTMHYAVAFKFAPIGTRDEKVNSVLRYMGIPLFLSAFTVLLSGFAMIPATTVLYAQIGIFMTIIAAVSWLNSSLFYLSLLSVWGPESPDCNIKKCISNLF